ncbi:MAG: ASPIC/UnbV domain-containing protein, partial [Spirosomataceae bacterium]
MDKSIEYGFDEASFSNGATYADLDNDGDLDVVINNVNQLAFIYQNKTNEQRPENHFIKLNLQGDSLNTKAVGAKVEVFADGQIFSKYLMPSRGFQSSTEYPLTFGLGSNETVDSLRIIWFNQRVTKTGKLSTDSTYNFSVKGAGSLSHSINGKYVNKYLVELEELPFNSHVENNYIDFCNEKNIPSMISREGPRATVGDIN